jgi:predicted dehydrogenase
MSTAPKLRVVIVGCGYQGALLAQAATRIESLRVTACVDFDLRLAAQLAGRRGHEHSFGWLEELLDQDLVDAVLVATPSS